MNHRLLFLLLPAGLLALITSGCGDSSGTSRPAPSADRFPSAEGRSIEELLRRSGAAPTDLVIAPAAQVFEPGTNRYPFGVFTRGGEQVNEADVALYFAREEDQGQAVGPLPARVTSLEVAPAYRAAGDEAGEAETAYVVPEVEFDHKGPWVALAMIRGDDGLEVSRIPSPVVTAAEVPRVGEKAPAVHTPTAADVGGALEKIDTRVPPDQMHEVDFAEVVGRKPVVLVFATPALCQSRVCGPVVDIAQQVADEYKDRVDFVHMEVYEGNDPNEGIRPQLRTYRLPTEPWTFVIDRRGIIRDRFEGAFGPAELYAAVEKIAS